ncbi:MAG: C4-dicarboxylate ABC transporter permease [Flammeovirgaceae bacterium]|nr:C4-dicarboxylate ABC transporter permease [Flammeovirgaceae bacterium]MBE62344.1 C4-dicarboxylate ABC transporter permease [Flammeovirgaceae bacterium]HCX21217.1 C4-dicarboxylate ABC transporter permease [Cytophagales bacterium]|tara:strand:+ start:76 stop:573 length:498 start_codon:yes stop_codon:yes gene_type:complete
MTMIKFIDHINGRIGQLVSWLTILLVMVIIGDVLMRYLFSITSAASFELEWHLFATIFLLGAGWTLQQDRHVRVDVFYNSFSARSKAWINLGGTIVLLFPLCIVGITEGTQFAVNAFRLGEVSPDPGGLPFRFIIKSTIPVGFLLLLLQGISEALKSIVKIKGGE